MTEPRLAESDLGRALDEPAECLENRHLPGDLFEITFHAPGIAARAEPGEFAQILVDDAPLPLLRRPFSFCRADPRQGSISFYVGVVGEGSRRLGRFRAGDSARILGPLGLGFTLPTSPGRSVLLAGGLGAAPFPLLMERLLPRGETVVFVNGARTAEGLYPPDLLPPGLAEVVTLTEDGSRGLRGRVTDGLDEWLPGAERCYACGPNPMLAAVVAEMGRPSRFPKVPQLEVSIEAPMGCGFGICLGCPIPIRDGDSVAPGLCCRQGPVLRAGQLDWERLLLQPAHLP